MIAHISTVVEFNPTKGEPTIVWRRWQHYDWLLYVFFPARLHVFRQWEISIQHLADSLQVCSDTYVCVPVWLHTSTDWSLWVHRRQWHFDWSHAHTCDCMIAHFNRGRFLSNKWGTRYWSQEGMTLWLVVCAHTCVFLHDCTHFNSGGFLFNTLETHYRSAEGDNTSCMCRCTHVCVTVLSAHVSTRVDFCPTKGELITGLQKAMTPWPVVQCTCTHVCVTVQLHTFQQR